MNDRREVQGGSPTPVYAVVLTALPLERTAMRRFLTDVREESHVAGTLYDVGTLASAATRFEVAVGCTGPGNTAAAVEFERAVERFSPSIALFIGVAGGVKDVEIGHVVAASKVYGYESGKAGESQFAPRPDVGQSAYPLAQRAQRESERDDWAVWLSRDGQEQPSVVPPVHVKPIAAGEKVIASLRAPIAEFIRSQYGDAIAVEMEGRGFLEGAYRNPRVGALVLRGISDLLSGKADADASGSQPLAARHASAFACQVMVRHHQWEHRQVASAAHAGVRSAAPSPPVEAGALLREAATDRPSVPSVSTPQPLDEEPSYRCGARLAEVRAALHMRPSEFVEFMQLGSETAYEAVERGAGEYPASALDRIADRTGYAPEWLRHSRGGRYAVTRLDALGVRGLVDGLMASGAVALYAVVEPETYRAGFVVRHSYTGVYSRRYTVVELKEGLGFPEWWMSTASEREIPRATFALFRHLRLEHTAYYGRVLRAGEAASFFDGTAYPAVLIERPQPQVQWWPVDLLDLHPDPNSGRGTAQYQQRYGTWFMEVQESFRHLLPPG